MNRNASSLDRRLEAALRRTVNLVLEFIRTPQNLQPIPVPVETNRRRIPPRSRR